jgi:hypothetical protein
MRKRYIEYHGEKNERGVEDRGEEGGRKGRGSL